MTTCTKCRWVSSSDLAQATPRTIVMNYVSLNPEHGARHFGEAISFAWNSSLEHPDKTQRYKWRKAVEVLMRTVSDKRRSAVVTPFYQNIDWDPVRESLYDLQLPSHPQPVYALAAAADSYFFPAVIDFGLPLADPNLLTAATRSHDSRWLPDSFYYIKHLAAGELVDPDSVPKHSLGQPDGVHSHFACVQMAREARDLSRLSARELQVAVHLVSAGIKDGTQLANTARDLVA